MNEPRRKMVISPLWLQFSILTFLIGFSVLGYLAYAIYGQHPPIPEQVVAEDGSLLFTRDDIMAGQHLFQKYGLMQFGTFFGHGAYLGQDFTAQYLHEAALSMLRFYGQGASPSPEGKARVEKELKQDFYDTNTRILVYSPGQVYAFNQLAGFYRSWFGPPVA